MYNGHNACLCILVNGEIVLNWELERFSRIKHDWGYNHKFLSKSLEICNLQMSDIDILLTNQQCYGRPPPFSVPSTANSPCVFFDANGTKSIAINHHLAHVSSSYFTSPFDEATIITQDGGGDDENFSTAKGVKNKIELFKTGRVQNLASYWSGLTLNNFRMPRLHEWDPGSGAGKIMALAAYGKSDNFIEKDLVETMDRGLKPYYTDPNSKAFNNNEDLSDTRSKRSQDVCASLQSLTEKSLSIIYNDVHKELRSDNLCVAGGLALNCVANTRAQSPFKNVHVPPFPNDTGLAVGMALYHWYHIEGNYKSKKYFSPYLGPIYCRDSVTEQIIKSGLKYEKLSTHKLANLISKGEIICFCRGRSESGPRALGHRSIICLPSRKDIRNIINFKIKKREWYRPFAPIILDKFSNDILQDFHANSPYMTTSAKIKIDWRETLNGVNHIDNSTRPQIIKEEHDKFMYDLLFQIYEITGIPVVLNTSFNINEPMVETPEEAIRTFLNISEVQFLALHDFLVSK